MKKITVIFVMLFVFLLVGFAHGQDCGKCPLKCNLAKKQPTDKKENPSDPMVYMKKNGKLYHQKSCQTVKDQEGYRELTLDKARKAGAKPCALCHPKVKPTISEKTVGKEKEKEK